MNNDKIAEEVIKSIGCQVDLIFSLSVAICGGIIVMLLQVAIHNRADAHEPLRLKAAWSLLVSFISTGLSILFGYLTWGAITSGIPAIYRIDFDDLASWGGADFVGSGTITFLALTQFSLFFIGIVFLFIMICKNYSILSGG